MTDNEPTLPKDSKPKASSSEEKGSEYHLTFKDKIVVAVIMVTGITLGVLAIIYTGGDEVWTMMAAGIPIVGGLTLYFVVFKRKEFPRSPNSP